jgi:hypothetical protein
VVASRSTLPPWSMAARGPRWHKALDAKARLVLCSSVLLGLRVYAALRWSTWPETAPPALFVVSKILSRFWLHEGTQHLVIAAMWCGRIQG